ncbi:MAG: DUF4136 domain-containing protein [Gemmatimonadetes bacterium]|nr:DUF4136 domain-containing protein [Gemmatimonadota bacterium]
MTQGTARGGRPWGAVRLAATLAALAASATAWGCGGYVRVTTQVAPGASFIEFRTFRILTPPPRRDGRRAPPDDLMVINSMTNQALRTHIADAFLARGYALDDATPTFTVAYYASSREKLDIELWDYGYRGRWWGPWRTPGPTQATTYYTEGTVVIDVIDARTNDLVWRGRGVARTTDDPAEFQRNLRDAVQAVVKRFPGR